MKKYSAILFCILYLVCTTGISADLHFCGGNLSGIAFWGKHNEKTCCGGKMQKPGCCDTKTAYYKLNVSHKPAPASSIAVKILKPLQAVNTCGFSVPVMIAEVPASNIHPKPPDKERHPVYITNRVLII